MTRNLFRTMVLLAVISGVSGCALASLNAAARPTDLYALTPKSTFDPNLPRVSDQIVVEEPTATSAVDTDRIAVQPNQYQVEYLGRARWVDRAPLIVQALLIESFENSNKVGAVGRSTVGIRADFIIVTDLREFQAMVQQDLPRDAPLEVLVGLNIKIIDANTDQIIASRSFEEKSYSATDDALVLAKAFDEAFGRSMRKAVEWSVRTMHAHKS